MYTDSDTCVHGHMTSKLPLLMQVVICRLLFVCHVHPGVYQGAWLCACANVRYQTPHLPLSTWAAGSHTPSETRWNTSQCYRLVLEEELLLPPLSDPVILTPECLSSDGKAFKDCDGDDSGGGEVRGFTASLSKVFHQWQRTIFPLDGAALSSVCSITTADSGFHLSHSLPRKLILRPELGVEKWGSPLQTSYHLSFLIFWKSADTKHLALDHTYEGIRMVSATFVSSVDCQHKSVPQWGAVWGKEQVKKER